MFDRRTFGERLKQLRTEAGIGQNKLAEDLQISNASVSYWETFADKQCFRQLLGNR